MIKRRNKLFRCQCKTKKETTGSDFFDSISCHPYHCEKSILYSQDLIYNRIGSDNQKVDPRCIDLEKWLMERGHSERMDKT